MRGLGAAVLPEACVRLACFEESRTTMSLLDSAFLAQIGKWRCAASSENMREQCGHWTRSSTCLAVAELVLTLRFEALSARERPMARRIYSLSSFHLGTCCSRIGRSSSVTAGACFRGGLAEATLVFRIGLADLALCYVRRPDSLPCAYGPVKSITLGA